MKRIVISSVLLILSISFLFGMFAFVEWNLDPVLWDVGTRGLYAFISGSIFIVWIVCVISFKESDKKFEK